MRTMILILLSTALASAQIAVRVGPGHSVPNPIRAGYVPHNHPDTPLFFEDFENPTGYDLAGWGENIVNGTVNEDYTATVLYGSQSCYLLIADDDQTYATNAITASSRVFVSFKLRIIGVTGADKTIFRLTDASGTCLFKITLNSDLDLKSHICETGASATTAFPPSLNTTYTVWAEWNKNNGANSYANIAFSTSGVRPTSGNNYAEVTSTTTATDATRIMIGSPNDEVTGMVIECIMDHVILDDVQIESYP